MDVGGSGVGELLQVPHAVGVLVGEGEVPARVPGGAVGDGEVADVQLLDLRLAQGYGLRLAQPLPAGRGEGGVGEVGDETAFRVGGEGGGVGVGDVVGDDLVGGRGPDGDGVAVGLAGPLAGGR
ncbi:hypothetical protein GCM10020000_58260 [Streptomyces olivoverticillatus]